MLALSPLCNELMHHSEEGWPEWFCENLCSVEKGRLARGAELLGVFFWNDA